jgi:hypothetical protein
MREVVANQFVQARPEEVGQLLDPAAIVSAEGSFSVTGVEETDSETIVGVSGPGIEFPLRFERNPDGYYYTADADVGPFDHMETWLTVDRENEGTVLTLRSKVSLNLPGAVLRQARWDGSEKLNSNVHWSLSGQISTDKGVITRSGSWLDLGQHTRR